MKEHIIRTRLLLPKTHARSCKTGHGHVNGHHGEIIQGTFEGQDNGFHRCLITLPCPLFGSRATFLPDPHGVVVTVEPDWKIKAQRAVAFTLRYCGALGWGGRLTVTSATPPRLGLGSSTSDVIAAILATGDALRVQIAVNVIARLAVMAETASDATMFGNHAVLFAHREGIVVEDLVGPLPTLTVLGFNTDSTGEGVDTLSLPPVEYDWQEREKFRPLLGIMRRAVRTQDPRLVGRAATASARINQRHLPKPHFDRLERLVDIVGAVGFQVSHSGTVAGILFDPSDPNIEDKIRDARSAVAGLGFTQTWCFRTNDHRKNAV